MVTDATANVEFYNEMDDDNSWLCVLAASLLCSLLAVGCSKACTIEKHTVLGDVSSHYRFHRGPRSSRNEKFPQSNFFHAFGITFLLQVFVFALSRLNMSGFHKAYASGFIPNTTVSVLFLIIMISTLCEAGHWIEELKRRVFKKVVQATFQYQCRASLDK